MKEIEASLKYIKGSFYKLNLVADLIRGMSVVEADAQLTFCDKRVALIVKKLLSSAVANAENNFKIDRDRLSVARVDVGKAMVLKRSMPRGRGRSTRIEKRFSNLRIVLEEQKNVVDNKKVVKKVIKKTSDISSSTPVFFK